MRCKVAKLQVAFSIFYNIRDYGTRIEKNSKAQDVHDWQAGDSPSCQR